jgi:hypothetical protein
MSHVIELHGVPPHRRATQAAIDLGHRARDLLATSRLTLSAIRLDDGRAVIRLEDALDQVVRELAWLSADLKEYRATMTMVEVL